MTLKERTTVEKLSRSGPSGFSGWVDRFIQYFMTFVGMPVVGMLIGGVVGAILEIGIGVHHAAKICIVVGMLLGLIVGMGIFRKDQRTTRVLHSRYRQDLLKGEVEVLHCTATDAVKVEEFEDEGTEYFVDVGDSTILFLQGQVLYDLDDVFPNRAFDIVRTPTSQVVLEVRCTGESFHPSRKRVALSNREYQLLHYKELVLFRGSLSTLEKDLKLMRGSREL